ncbi:hypothetical protein F4804DRAFT_332000 [Jackrogersella minutella]|nr:hypothetical protein F4804DRAFT_332000 [Jackrogersella minutella]
MDFSSTPDYHGDTEMGLNGWLIGFSTFFYGLRLYVRIAMTKSPGLDDGIAGIAYVLLVFLSVMDIHAVTFGSGTHLNYIPQDILSKFFEALAIQTLLYFWAVAMVRFAILAFLPRLAQDRSIGLISWAVAAIILAQTITAFVYRLTECTVLADDFKALLSPGIHCVKLSAHNEMMIGHGVVGIAVDAILLLLPIWVICTRMMWSKKTLQIILVLSVGVFAVATGIIRVVLITTRDYYTDITFEMPFLGIWTNVEGHVGLWCGCFPALQPLIRIASAKLKLLGLINSNGDAHEQLERNLTKTTCGGSGEYHNAMDGESQRAIVLTEMKSSERAMRNRDTSPV